MFEAADHFVSLVSLSLLLLVMARLSYLLFQRLSLNTQGFSQRIGTILFTHFNMLHFVYVLINLRFS